MGIDPSSVHSPTFTYVNEYDEKMVHLDMYRLETEQDALYKGIFDIIDDHDHVVIERPKWTEQYVE